MKIEFCEICFEKTTQTVVFGQSKGRGTFPYRRNLYLCDKCLISVMQSTADFIKEQRAILLEKIHQKQQQNQEVKAKS